jgi:hypothetical protein
MTSLAPLPEGSINIQNTRSQMDIFLAFVVGWIVGSKITSVWNTMVYKELLKDLGVTDQQVKQLAKDSGIEVDDDSDQLEQIEIKIEQVGDQLYAYRVDTDQFLGQGQDREALIQRLTQTMNNVRLIVSKEHGSDLIKGSQ